MLIPHPHRCLAAPISHPPCPSQPNQPVLSGPSPPLLPSLFSQTAAARPNAARFPRPPAQKIDSFTIVPAPPDTLVFLSPPPSPPRQPPHTEGMHIPLACSAPARSATGTSTSFSQCFIPCPVAPILTAAPSPRRGSPPPHPHLLNVPHPAPTYESQFHPLGATSSHPLPLPLQLRLPFLLPLLSAPTHTAMHQQYYQRLPLGSCSRPARMHPAPNHAPTHPPENCTPHQHHTYLRQAGSRIRQPPPLSHYGPRSPDAPRVLPSCSRLAILGHAGVLGTSTLDQDL